MSNSAIHLSVNQLSSQTAGELLVPANKATIEFFDVFEAPTGTTSVSFGSLDGIAAKGLVSANLPGVGELRCISQACVSDVSVFESSESLASVDPGLLASVDAAGIMTNMNDQISFQALNTELLSALPRVKHALDGELSHAELTQLIVDIQAQVLELNSLSQDMFGDLSLETSQAVADAGQQDSDGLLVSMHIDSGLLAQPDLAAGVNTLSSAATLDGLFTSPEAFPLTLDFSSPSRVQEASELFASTGGSSSISSTASNSETDSGLSGTNPGSSDLT